MSRPKRATRWLGGLQEQILVWITLHSPAVEDGVVARGYLPPDEDGEVAPHFRRAKAQLLRQAHDAAGDHETLRATLSGRPWVPWKPPKTPANARSAHSKALRRLEERGLVTRDRTKRRDDTKARHTTRVRLTPTGVEAVVHLLLQDLQAAEVAAEAAAEPPSERL